MASELTQRTRRYDLDWLRIIAFLLLILYHIGMFYVPWSWHVKSVHAPVGAVEAQGPDRMANLAMAELVQQRASARTAWLHHAD